MSSNADVPSHVALGKFQTIPCIKLHSHVRDKKVMMKEAYTRNERFTITYRFIPHTLTLAGSATAAEGRDHENM